MHQKMTHLFELQALRFRSETFALRPDKISSAIPGGF